MYDSTGVRNLSAVMAAHADAAAMTYHGTSTSLVRRHDIL